MPRLYLVNENGRVEIKYTIDSNIIVADKQKIEKGQPLTSGPLNPHDVIRLKGPEAAQQYLVDEVQRVYRSQGVEIADKHVEIIVRGVIHHAGMHLVLAGKRGKHTHLVVLQKHECIGACPLGIGVHN